MSHPLPWVDGRDMSLVSEEEGLTHKGEGKRHPRCEWAHEGFGITFREWSVRCGEVLRRERDVITDVDTVIALVTYIAKEFAKVKLL